MTDRHFAFSHPLDNAIDTLTWVRREEDALRKLTDLVQQNPAVFGEGQSALTLAADLLEKHVDVLTSRQTELKLVDPRL